MDDEPSTVHVRVLCALLASAARLVPVPLIDDWLRERVLRYMVGRTLGAHGRTYPTKEVKPLYAGDGGCIEGCLTALFWLPLKLLLYPIRKVVAWVLAARGLSQDMTEMLLLGRTLDRCLAAGMLRHGTRLQHEAEARLIRRAYDNAARGFDSGVLRSAVANALGSVKGLPGAAVRTLRAMRRGRGDDVRVPAEEQATIDRGVGAVERTLERPDVAAALARFDETFEQNLRHLQGLEPARPPS